MSRIRITSRLAASPKAVWQKEVIWLLHVVSVVGPMPVSFMMASQVASSAINAHFIKECPKNNQGCVIPGNRAQSSSVAPPDRVESRGATSGTRGGENRLYTITRRQEQEKSPNVVTDMIKVFNFDVNVLVDLGTILSFITPYVAN